MSLPPQEPPRGPPSLNVSHKSHKVKKTTAGTSRSQHPGDWTLAQLEKHLPLRIPPPPAAAGGRSILQGPPGYFPDRSGSFLPRQPIIPPPPGTSFFPRPPDFSASAAARSIGLRPSASSEYSPSAASLPPESPSASSSAASTPSPESLYDEVDSTKPLPPPPSPDSSA